MSNVKLALAALALVGCAAAEPVSAASTEALTSTPKGCAVGAAPGQIAIEFHDATSIRAKFYDASGAETGFTAEWRVKPTATGWDVQSRATGGGVVFRIVRDGDGYQAVFSADLGNEGGFEGWASVTTAATCSASEVPALTTILAPAPEKLTSGGFRTPLTKHCTATERNAKGELWVVDLTSEGWGEDTASVHVTRYDAKGHAELVAQPLGHVDGGIDLYEFDNLPGSTLNDPVEVSVGTLAVKSRHVFLTANTNAWHRTVGGPAQQLADVVGTAPIELSCE